MLHSASRAVRWRNTASLQRPARAEERHTRPLVVHGHHGLGMLYVAMGQHEKARQALTMAIERCRAMEMARWLPRPRRRWRRGTRDDHGGEPSGLICVT